MVSFSQVDIQFKSLFCDTGVSLKFPHVLLLPLHCAGNQKCTNYKAIDYIFCKT